MATKVKAEDKCPKLLDSSISKRQSGNLNGADLASVLVDLENKFDDGQIALACGYYETISDNKKAPLLDSYLKAKEAIGKPIKTKFEHETFSIFKGRLCVTDGEHCDEVFYPERIYEKMEYTQKILFASLSPESFDVDYLLEEEWCQNEEEARLLLDKSFNEPMLRIELTRYLFLNQKLEKDWEQGWLSVEDVAEIEGLDPKECIYQVSFDNLTSPYKSSIAFEMEKKLYR